MKVIKEYYHDLPLKVWDDGINLSFSDFIHWIEDGNENEHWKGPYHIGCNPCQINYDRIVKLETQDSDSKYII